MANEFVAVENYLRYGKYDRHINAGQKCLKRQFGEQAGLQDTLVLNELAVYKSSKENFVQILNVNASHWVCISNKGLPPGIVAVFDSMPSIQRIPHAYRSRCL